jgi:multidrug efflux pump
MNIGSVSIQRPVLASVISIFIVLFGAVGFTYLACASSPAWTRPW